MEFLRRHVRYAWRMAVKSPGVTCTTLLVLALGIGATTAVLSLISEVLLAPPPFADPQRLFEVKNNLSVPNGLDLQAQASTVEQIALADIGGDFSLTEVSQPRNLFGAATCCSRAASPAAANSSCARYWAAVAGSSSARSRSSACCSSSSVVCSASCSPTGAATS